MPNHQSYYPEMGDAKPQAEIEASLSHYGKHYFLKTRLTLKGRGIKFLGTMTAETLTPQAQHRAGTHRYKVTEKAYEKICREHSVSYEILLD